MPINDNNPERRNLNVLSSSIIAFYVGGAAIGEEGLLQLPLLNIKFHDGAGLAMLAWIVLIWFLIRYWLQNKRRLVNEFCLELHDESYLSGIFGKYLKEREGKYSEQAYLENSFKYRFHLQEGKTVDDSKSLFYYQFSLDSAHTGIGGDVPTVLDGRLKYLVFFFLGFRLFFSRPSLSANLGPLFLAFCAFGIGIYNYIHTPPPICIDGTLICNGDAKAIALFSLYDIFLPLSSFLL